METLYTIAYLVKLWSVYIAIAMAVPAVALMPLVLLKGTRDLAGMVLFTFSYFFGFVYLAWSAATATVYLGLAGLLAGTALLIVGLIPTAMIGAINSSQWDDLQLAMVGFLITIGSRYIGAKIMRSKRPGLPEEYS
mgnify:CR=1 FL=1